MMTGPYKALLSSDWNECLAPCGPFDALVHHHPQRARELDRVFRQYSGNAISLGTAVRQIERLVPEGLAPIQMDAYLDRHFRTYAGVAGLIRWCQANQVLFMINTTGMIGYFQRVHAKGLMPPVPVLSAHPLIRFDPLPSDPPKILALQETTDKARHTAAIAAACGIAPNRIFVMGDSGGDGPHFEWAAQAGARLIAAMAKASLLKYCRERGIEIHYRVGRTHPPGEKRSLEREMAHDFGEIRQIVGAAL
jgi:hypothetical protein